MSFFSYCVGMALEFAIFSDSDSYLWFLNNELKGVG